MSQRRELIDDRGVGDLYHDHVWDVYGFLAYRVNRRETAEDLTQATFERAVRAWDGYDPQRASARTWLLAIARNLLIDHYRVDRSARNEPLAADDVLDAALGHAPGPEASLGVDPALHRALRTLSARDREIVALRYGGDLTGPEIAEMLGLTLANVQQILSRSLRKLREELAPAGS